ncbi:hypothetical protein [Dermabacter hominis]|uniref:hypothetical protein n=1 Tax=Dermabacter hominis TaxID=36740 RepID=UPI00223BCDC7|nr:hypothetical protein [Dermabacter hominis]MCT2026202.1 hypothetical protein [Dermabacter hominis]
MNTQIQLPTETREELEARIERDKASLKLLKDRERFLGRKHFEIEANTLKLLCRNSDESFNTHVNELREKVSEHMWSKHLEALEAKREAREREAQESAGERSEEG